MLTLILRSLAVLLFLFVFDLTSFYLTFIVFKTLKQALSNEPLHNSTGPLKLIYPFLPLGLLLNKTNHKQTFEIAFINSRLLASNHAQVKVDLSFTKYSCSAAMWLNRLWKLKLLDPKPVYIMKTFFFATEIFCDLLFAS